MNVFHLYQKALMRRPVITKMATGGTLAFSSDLVAQSVESDRWDRKRSTVLTLFGFGYMGLFQHYVFGYYARRWPIDAAKHFTTNAKPVICTTAVHMLITYPFIYFPCFIVVTDTLARGKSISQAWDHIVEVWWRLYKPGFLVWTPVMAVQFLFIPLPLQILWITSFSFAWTTFMSLSLFKKTEFQH